MVEEHVIYTKEKGMGIITLNRSDKFFVEET